MESLPSIIESRRDEISMWLAPGIEINITTIATKDFAYRASIAEFDLIADGLTEEETLDALMERLSDLITTFMQSGASLPDRSEWLAAHPIRPTGSVVE